MLSGLVEAPLPPVYLGYTSGFVLATAACLGAAWRARSLSRPDVRRALLAFFLGSAGWAGTYVGFLLAGSPTGKHLFYQGSLIVGFGTVFAWLWFCSVYSGRRLHRRRGAWYFAAAVFVAVTALKVTNPWHGLYYRLEPTGGAFGLVVTHETLYWVVMALAYALAAAGYLMIFEAFLRARARTGPLAVLTGLTALPAALNVIGHVEPALLDITHEPLGVAVFAVGLLFAYETQFRVVQRAGNVEDPNLTVGREGRIRGFGGGVARIVPPLGEGGIGRPLAEVLPGLAEVLGAGEVAVWSPEFEGRTRHYRVVTADLEEGVETRTAILSDITEQKRREETLRKLREKYQGLLEGAPNAIFVADVESGHIVEANQAAASLLGTTTDEIIGRDQSELHPSEDARKYRSLFRQAKQDAEKGSKVFSELKDGTQTFVETDSGEHVPVEISVTLVELGGEEAGEEVFVEIFRDITERKRKAERLRRAKDQAERARLEAEEASQMKSAMLANMSHEIRTPLTSIIGFAEAIGEEISGREEVARFADLIEGSGRRLLDTLDAVLNLSKLEAEEMSLKARPVDLGEQAREIAEELRPQAEEGGLVLAVEAEKAGARADEGGVKIVLQNLLSNAIKYTEEGRVEVRTYREGETAIIEVEDTGIGMEPEVAEGLFEPFRQASEGLSREYEGTGVGLAVTKKATEQMGGTIDIETQKGEGSRFTVRLPAAEEGSAEKGAVEKGVARDGNAQDGGAGDGEAGEVVLESTAPESTASDSEASENRTSRNGASHSPEYRIHDSSGRTGFYI